MSDQISEKDFIISILNNAADEVDESLNNMIDRYSERFSTEEGVSFLKIKVLSQMIGKVVSDYPANDQDSVKKSILSQIDMVVEHNKVEETDPLDLLHVVALGEA